MKFFFFNEIQFYLYRNQRKEAQILKDPSNINKPFVSFKVVVNHLDYAIRNYFLSCIQENPFTKNGFIDKVFVIMDDFKLVHS